MLRWAYRTLFLDMQGENGIAGARCPPTIAFFLTGKGEANRGTLKINTLFGANAFSFRLSTKKQIREFQTAVCDSISLLSVKVKTHSKRRKL